MMRSKFLSIIFLQFLLINSISYPFPSTVINLDDENFYNIVDKRDNKTIFMVMFHGDRCPACRAAYPAFSEASRKGIGLVSFGHVDCSANSLIPYRFKIRAIPTFIVFHPGGESSFSSFRRTASTFLNGALSYLPDYTVPANASWIDFKNHPENKNISAIVFLTLRWSIPDEWKTLAFNFSTYPNIIFGSANDRHTKKDFIEAIKENKFDIDIQKEFSKTKDIFIFIKNGSVTKYEGKFSFRKLQSDIYRHFNLTRKVYEKPQEKISTKVDFIAMCFNKQRYCVVDTTNYQNEKKPNDSLSYALKNISKSEKYTEAPFRFLICGKRCPNANMKSKRVYIFNKNKDEMIEINLENLVDDANNQKQIEKIVSDNLDKVLANEAQWVPSVCNLGTKQKSKQSEL